jgi:predicted chitinase
MALSESDIAKLITPAALKKMAPAISAGISAALVRDCPKVFAANGIDSVVRIRHFFAQVTKETGGLKRLDENMFYTTLKALRAPFKAFRTMSDAEASGFLKNPKKLANFVYAKRNGNGDVASGDGFTYRGSGLIQVTGRGNYKTVGDLIKIDLVAKPDLARSEDSCVQVAVAYWTARKINSVADADTLAAVDAVTARVNPGETGKGKLERRELFKRARAAFA